jgi:hypothetical protein
MQVRQNAIYLGGTGVVDLRQFGHGFGRHLVQEAVAPDHHVYLGLDEYLETANRKHLGFTASSEEIAEYLLGLYPARDMLLALAQLNRFRSLPDQLEQVRQEYMHLIPTRAALRMNGLTTGGAEPHHFLARQLILLAMRATVLRNSVGVTEPPMSLGAAAIMLTHALAARAGSGDEGPSVWEGMPANVLMEVVCNDSFNSTENLLSRLDRMWGIYVEQGDAAAVPPPRAPFRQMAAEALGADIGVIVSLGLLLDQTVTQWRSPSPVLIPQRFVRDARPEDLHAFLALVSADSASLRIRLAKHADPWGFLPFEETPVLRFDDEMVVLDQEYLQRRITSGVFWAVGEHERTHHGGDKAWRAWSMAHGQAVEAVARKQIRALAPRIPDLRAAQDLPTYFTDQDLIRAYPVERKGATPIQSDAAVWLGQCWLLFEIVAAELKVPTRQGRQLDDFRTDVERMVMKKLRQLHATADNILSDNGQALLGYQPPRPVVQPILVQGGHFPVHPATIAYIDDQIRRESLFQHARVRRPAILHLDELEALEAIVERAQDLVAAFDEWQRSERKAAPFRNFLVSRDRHDRPSRLGHDRQHHLIVQLSQRVSRTSVTGSL